MAAPVRLATETTAAACIIGGIAGIVIQETGTGSPGNEKIILETGTSRPPKADRETGNSTIAVIAATVDRASKTDPGSAAPAMNGMFDARSHAKSTIVDAPANAPEASPRSEIMVATAYRLHQNRMPI